MRSIALLVVVFVSPVLRAEPTLVGLSLTGHRASAAVAGELGGSRWVSVGERVDDYTVAAIDIEGDAVTIERSGVRTLLRLAIARTAAGEPPAEWLRAIAEREVETNEGGMVPVAVGVPQPYGDGYRVMVRLELMEARLIFISKDGRVTDYWKA